MTLTELATLLGILESSSLSILIITYLLCYVIVFPLLESFAISISSITKSTFSKFLTHTCACIDQTRSDSPISNHKLRERDVFVRPIEVFRGDGEESTRPGLYTQRRWRIMWGLWTSRRPLRKTNPYAYLIHTHISLKFCASKGERQARSNRIQVTQLSVSILSHFSVGFKLPFSRVSFPET